VFDNKQFSDIVEGTPQSGAISPVLANIALHGARRKTYGICPNLGSEKFQGKSEKLANEMQKSQPNTLC